ncbi:MAG TPA: CRISPR-associated endonuclease Cas1 [Candidatus Limnocylindria bacterium]|nr:CRISPR-associated endonuclease Cas1 [Candidatus Limnocylindria bacterium]
MSGGADASPTSDVPLVPARMVNEWVYCPRLAWLEWVEGQWAESGDTAQGRRVHARVDVAGPALPDVEAVEAGAELKTRSVMLSSERLGLIAKIDLLETAGGSVTPVDYKKGKRPHVAEGAFEPERVQVCAQALVLEDNGYTVAEGMLWFAESRERVRVVLDDDLRARTIRAIAELRRAAAGGEAPPPLENSPKCPRCSLLGICLPDEVNYLRGHAVPRPIVVPDEPSLPLYVQSPGARVRKDGETIQIETDEGRTEARLIDVSELAVYGPVSVSTPLLHELMSREIPVAWFSSGGWFMGHTTGAGEKNVAIRVAQYRAALDETRALAIARGIVAAKIRNARTILRRNWKQASAEVEREQAMNELKWLALRAERARDADQLLGLEGEAAAVHFRHFARLLSPPRSSGKTFTTFAFEHRNRRPPTDPVNALLSYAYGLLLRTVHVALAGAGFDPYLGFYHRPRHGRPALALDLMEPYRPLLADSTVINAINNGEVKPWDFVYSGPACALTKSGRRALIASYERRLDQETTHPLFGYRLSMRRLLSVQARLLARHLLGETDSYPHYVPR